MEPAAPEAGRFAHLTDILVSETTGSEPDLRAVLNRPGPAGFVPDYTGADDPALLMYTSGSTAMPTSILHGHRLLPADRPSINLFYDQSREGSDAVFWSPSDWAWAGGLLAIFMPAWLAGRPIATSEVHF